MALIGWQVSSISRLGSALYEVAVVGQVEINQALHPKWAFLDVTKVQLEQLHALSEKDKLHLSQNGSVEIAGVVRLRPVVGHVKWHEADQMASIRVTRFGDLSEASAGSVMLAKASFSPPLPPATKVFVSHGDVSFL